MLCKVQLALKIAFPDTSTEPCQTWSALSPYLNGSCKIPSNYLWTFFVFIFMIPSK